MGVILSEAMMTSKKKLNSPDLSDVLIACRVMCAAGLCHQLTYAENLGNILVEELERAAKSPRIDATLAQALKKIAKDANAISDRLTEAQVEWSDPPPVLWTTRLARNRR